MLWCQVGNTGVNLIKLLHLQFKSVAIVLESENSSYTTMAQEGHSPVLVFDSPVTVLHSPVLFFYPVQFCKK